MQEIKNFIAKVLEREFIYKILKIYYYLEEKIIWEESMKKNKKLLIVLFVAVIVLIVGIKSLNSKNKEENYYSVNNSPNEIAENKVDNEDKNNTEEEMDKDELTENINIEYINLSPEEVYIPILMYHSIAGDDPNNNLLVAPEMFNEQMKWLSDNGFTAMSLNEVNEAFSTGKVPKKPVAITFDDGYADNYLEAFPILKQYNMKGTFFIITNNTDKDGYYMTSDMLREMKAAGMSIENHTAYHFELGGASLEDQKQSIEDGQRYLNENIGVEGSFLCYPAGKYDETTIDLDKELSVKAAVTTEYGLASINDGIYTLKRIRISPMNLDSFASIFSSFTE